MYLQNNLPPVIGRLLQWPLLGLAGIWLILSGCGDTDKKNQKLHEYVNPFIGTGGHGHTYPGASVPFGMVQLSPDTRLTGWDGCSGYHYSDSIIYGFSHTHLSGTGVSDYGDILLKPTANREQIHLNNGADGNPGYRSRFSHKTEKARPGYYAVHLEDDDIRAELTVTPRTGFHKYTFPESNNATIVIDLNHRDKTIDSRLRIVGKIEIEGFRRSEAWAKDQHVYFVARFSKPFSNYGVAEEIESIKVIGDEKEKEGNNIKGYVSFETQDGESILVKVGISAVSIEGARSNLDAELPDWDFENTVAMARKTWNEALGKIEVKGGTEDEKTIFYTALYHSLLNPNLYMDVDSQFRGTDLKVHKAADHTNYTVFSLWDTYRATHPLFTILEQERTNDFIKTFLAQYEKGGQLPVWELAANYTGCMIGYHSIPVIADAYQKGIRGYDPDKAFEAMKHSAEQDHLGLDAYKALGFIPADVEPESVSKTLEYAYDDWCIAQMAKSLGRDEDYQWYIQRAQYYKNIFDPSTRFMRAKINHSWFSPFDPAEVNYNYTEANAWQYSFYVPQDISTLIELMGGRETMIKQLNALFIADSKTTGRDQADITGMIGQYAHGNEPSHHMAYLYSYVNMPWETQRLTRKIMKELYTNEPDGLSGNEDCGQMSSWYVFSAMGFYPVTPAQGIYVIGSPVFKKVTINLENGNQFSVRAENVSDKHIYIRDARLNQKPYSRSYITHEDIMAGGELVFTMTDKPYKEWGVMDDDVPVSRISDYQITAVPHVLHGKRTFLDHLTFELGTNTDSATIYYTLDGTAPDRRSGIYTGPITIDKTTTLKAFAYKKGLPSSVIIEATFKKIPPGRTITLNTQYANQYSAGGDLALIDFTRGSGSYRTGYWQGYEGVNIEAIVDLGKAQAIKKLGIGFLQDENSWIFMPAWVEFATSMDGKIFNVAGRVKNDVSPKQTGTVLKDFEIKTNRKARFIKMVAKNNGECPPWHKGAGGKAWIFADEILIE